MEKLNIKVQKLIIWASAYINFIALILVGLYTFKHIENEEAKKTVKKAGIFCLIFVGVGILINFFSTLLSGIFFVNTQRAFTIINSLAIISEIVILVVFASLDIFSSKKNDEKKVEVIVEEKAE